MPTCTSSGATMYIVILLGVLVATCGAYKQSNIISQCIMGNKTNNLLGWRCDVDELAQSVRCQQPGTPHFTKCYMSVSPLHYFFDL